MKIVKDLSEICFGSISNSFCLSSTTEKSFFSKLCKSARNFLVSAIFNFRARFFRAFECEITHFPEKICFRSFSNSLNKQKIGSWDIANCLKLSEIWWSEKIDKFFQPYHQQRASKSHESYENWHFPISFSVICRVEDLNIFDLTSFERNSNRKLPGKFKKLYNLSRSFER